MKPIRTALFAPGSKDRVMAKALESGADAVILDLEDSVAIAAKPEARKLVAALIEARSCERFGILRDHLADRDLADFFGSLYESEARHHGSYVQLAQLFATRDEVRARLAELAEAEAAIILEGEPLARVHS